MTPGHVEDHRLPKVSRKWGVQNRDAKGNVSDGFILAREKKFFRVVLTNAELRTVVDDQGRRIH